MAGILEDNPVLAVAPIVEAAVTQLKTVQKRRAWNRKKKAEFGSLGWTHWTIDNLSIWISVLISAAAILSSLSFLFSAGLHLKPAARVASDAMDWNQQHYSFVLVAWLIHAILVHTNAIAYFLRAIIWIVPAWRQTLGFTNATWHIQAKEDANAIALGRENQRKIAGEIVASLVGGPPNANMALRPADLTDAEAANVLFFGHVIENALTSNNIRWKSEKWTGFYEALGKVARSDGRPLSPAAISSFNGVSFHHEVVAKLSDFIGEQQEKLPSEYEIPRHVDSAFRFLVEHFGGDGRDIGRTIVGYSYPTALRKSKKIPDLDLEEIRRQFAKLAINWNIWIKARRPSVFKIPFSRSIAIFLLENGWLKTDATRLRTDDIYFLNAFDTAQEGIVELAATIVKDATDTKTREWFDTLGREAQKKKIAEPWYLRYRIDQHIYHLAQAHTKTQWSFGDHAIVRNPA